MNRAIATVFRYSTVYPSNANLSSSGSTFQASKLKKQLATTLKPLPTFTLKSLPFGKYSTDHMITVCYDSIKGWDTPKMIPFQNLSIDPFNSTLHYAVECFEGMKAYKNQQGKIRLFRPECNALRMKKSSMKIALPDFDGNEFVKLVEEYARAESRWIPSISQFSLYIRPLHISMENSLGVKSPLKSQLLIMSCPVGPYFPTGFKAVSISCSGKSIRSAPGGSGFYKVGSNYGPTLVTAKKALQKNYDQVLWLYKGQIIEVGASNIFFVFKNPGGKPQIATPLLKDLVLPGVTRDSVLTLLSSKQDTYTVSERTITIQEVIQRIKKNELLECFCSGTAVIINSVKLLEFEGEEYPCPYDQKKQLGPIAESIRKEILDIQQGRIQDPFGWSRVVN